MPDHLPPVNYLAVLVSAIAIFALGGAWYSKAMFAPRWMKLLGMTDASMDPEKRGLGLLLVQAFISGLIASWAMAVVLEHFQNVPLTWLRGVGVACLVWLGFAGVTSYSNTIFSGRPRQLWVIDSGYNLVSFIIAGVILSLWR